MLFLTGDLTKNLQIFLICETECLQLSDKIGIGCSWLQT